MSESVSTVVVMVEHLLLPAGRVEAFAGTWEGADGCPR